MQQRPGIVFSADSTRQRQEPRHVPTHLFGEGNERTKQHKKNFYKSQKNIKIEQRRRRKNIQPYTLHYRRRRRRRLRRMERSDVLLLRFFAFSSSCIFLEIPTIRDGSPRAGSRAVSVGCWNPEERCEMMIGWWDQFFRFVPCALQFSKHRTAQERDRGIGVMCAVKLELGELR